VLRNGRNQGEIAGEKRGQSLILPILEKGKNLGNFHMLPEKGEDEE